MAKHLFRSGDPKRGGRQKGTPNKSTLEGRAFARQLVDDPIYRQNLRERLLAGKVPAGVEVMLWYYAHGKPRETLELTAMVGTRDVSTMDTSELLHELEAHHAATAQFLAQHHGQQHTQGD